MVFNPKEVSTFYFEDVRFDEQTLELRLEYSFDKKYKFEESYIFKGGKAPQSIEQKQALNNAITHLHLMAGVSYYKAALPKNIKTPNYSLSKKTAKLFEELYTKGLSEFAYVNDIDLNGNIQFPWVNEDTPEASDINLSRKTVIPVGGGKDSVVTIEILKASKEPLSLFVMGSNAAILKVAGISKLPVINVTRKISPALLELNNQGAYNGHVPISAILSFLLVVSSIVYDFDCIAMSYESSASSPTLEHNGQAVNHQYSKSLECEKLIKDYIENSILTNLCYFSFIRPLSELAVTSLFSKYCEYHSDFTSCNGYFKISGNKDNKALWCNNCPKCRFVYLALAPFMDKISLIKIFGRNLLDFEDQLKGYEELCGISGHKPFECVGEIEESRFAIKLLSQMPAWNNDLIIRTLSSRLPSDSQVDYLHNFSDEHLMPDRFKDILNAHLRS